MAALNGKTAPVSSITGGFTGVSGSNFIALSWPLAVFLLALVPRLTELSRRPFWCDEVLTAERSALPLPALIRAALAVHHTPVYFLLMTPLAHLPDPQFWLRLPSAILGALNVMMVFRIANNAGGRMAGIGAALIMGLAPTEIAYSQEARSYMLMIFCLLIALQALIALAQDGERAALPWRDGGLGWIWLQFIAGSTAAFCILGDSLPWLLAAGVTATVMISRAQNRSGLLRNFLSAAAISLTCCLPLYIAIRLQAGSVHNSLNFVPVLTAALVWYDMESVYLMRVCDFLTAHFMAVPTPHALSVVIGAGLGISGLGGVWRLRQNPMMAAALLPAVFTLPLLLGIFSILRPVLMARYLLWSGPPFAILAGIGLGAALEKWPPSARYGAFAAMSLLLLFNLVPFYHVETKPRWDIAAQIFAARARPQDVEYFYDYNAGRTMRYYLPVKWQPYLLVDYTGDFQQAEQAHAQGKRVWVIYGLASNIRYWKSLADFRATLAPLGTPSAEMHAGGRIIMWRYDP